MYIRQLISSEDTNLRHSRQMAGFNDAEIPLKKVRCLRMQKDKLLRIHTY